MRHEKIVLRLAPCDCGCGGLKHRRSIRRQVRFVETHSIPFGDIERAIADRRSEVVRREIGEVRIGRRTILVGRVFVVHDRDECVSDWYAIGPIN